MPVRSIAAPLRRLQSTLRRSDASELHLAASASFLLLIRAATYLITFVTGVVLARSLGPDTRGIYGLITVIVAYSVYLDFGASPAGVYLVSRRTFSYVAVASNGLVLSVVLSGLWVLLMAGLAVTRPSFIPAEFSTAYFAVMAAVGCCRIIIVFSAQLALASGRVLNTGLIEVTEPCLRALLILGVLVLAGANLDGVLVAWLAAVAVTAVLSLYLLCQGKLVRPHLQVPLSRQLFSFGLRTWTGGVAQAVNFRLDVFFVAAMLTAADLGHYAVAFGLAEMFWQIPMVAAFVLFPKAAASDGPANAEITAKTCRRVLFVNLVAVVLLFVAAKWLIGLYGPEYQASLTPFLILAPSALLVCVYKVLSSGLAAGGMPEAPLYAGGAAIPLMVGACLLLIPTYGIVGAAAASMAAYSVNALVTLVLFLRATGLPVSSVLVPRRSDIPASIRGLKTTRASESNVAV